MLKKLVIIFVIASILAATVAADKDYYIGDFVKVNWFQALLICNSQGYTLASITSKDDNKALQNYLADNDADGIEYWISGNNLGDQSAWYWQSTGKKIVYTHWARGQPNNYGGNERCIQLREDFLWNDAFCGKRFNFVCEKDA